MPLFSIIVPVYNTERYLKDCVDSIINQTFNDWELILINDGSTDSSKVICEQYAQKHKNIYVIHKPNEGVSIARKIGCEHAKGEYIVFVDSDDYISSSLLFTVFKEMKKQKADVYISNLIIQHPNKIIKSEKIGFHGYYNKEKIIKYI